MPGFALISARPDLTWVGVSALGSAMLLNEFLKEHRKVEELEANAARQQKQIDALTAGL